MWPSDGRAVNGSAGSAVAREHRVRPIDECLPKIEELVAWSSGNVRVDVLHRWSAGRGSLVVNALPAGWLRMCIGDCGRDRSGSFGCGSRSRVCGCSG